MMTYFTLILVFFGAMKFAAEAQVSSLFNARFAATGSYGIVERAAGNFHAFGLSDTSKTFEKGSGSSLGGGIFVEYPLTSHINVHLGADYRSTSLEFEHLERDAIEIDGEIFPAIFGHYVGPEVYTGQLSLGLSVEVASRLFVLATGRVDFALSSGFSRREQWIEPTDRGRYDNGRRIRNEFEGDEIPSLNTTLFGVGVGLRYELPMNQMKSFFLVPHASYQHTFGNLVSDKDLSAISGIRVGVGIMYHVPAFGKVASPIEPGVNVPTREK